MSSQRPPARHVHAAVSAAMQPKMPQPQSSVGVASHVQAMISAAAQPKMSRPWLPAGFANHVQKAISAGGNHSTVQLMQATGYCSGCGQTFKGTLGLNAHLRQSSCGVDDDMSDAESVLSNWSSKTERAKPKVFGSRSGNQQDQFDAFRKEVGKNFNIHTSTNLANLVKEAGHGGDGRSTANTHVLVSHAPNIADGKRAAFGLTKLSGIAQALNKSGVVVYEGRTREVGNVHAEMLVIYEASGHKEGNVKDCLAGAHLVVDKPICEDCYKWVLLANPSVIQDNHNSNEKRGKWPNWTSPFS